MKRLLFTLMALAAMTFAMAQSEENVQKKERGNRPDPKEMIEKRTQEMIEKYALSTEQAEKVRALNEKYMKGGPRGGGRGQRPEMRDGQRPEKPEGEMADGDKAKGGKDGKGRGGRGRGQNMEKYNEELRTILNDTQYKAYEADMQKRMSERKERKEKKD